MRLCPNCNQAVHDGAEFCGNCGFKLSGVQLKEVALPPPVNSPAKDDSGKAIAAFVLGVLGLVGWIIPIIGVCLGSLAIILGTMSFRSRRRTFAIIGMVLAALVIAVSLFFWIRAAQNALTNNSSRLTGLSKSAAGSSSQSIATPCFATKIPAVMTVTKTAGSCTFLAASSSESYEVKIMQIAQLTASNLSQAAKTDISNVVNSTPGGSMSSQGPATFIGYPAYSAIVSSSDGSAATIYYVYKETTKGNLVIVFHTTKNGYNHDLSSIENSWVWR